MSIIPLHLQRRFEQRWAAKLARSVASVAPKSISLKRAVQNSPRPAKEKEKPAGLNSAGLVGSSTRTTGRWMWRTVPPILPATPYIANSKTQMAATRAPASKSTIRRSSRSRPWGERKLGPSSLFWILATAEAPSGSVSRTCVHFCTYVSLFPILVPRNGTNGFHCVLKLAGQ